MQTTHENSPDNKSHHYFPQEDDPHHGLFFKIFETLKKDFKELTHTEIHGSYTATNTVKNKLLAVKPDGHTPEEIYAELKSYASLGK